MSTKKIQILGALNNKNFVVQDVAPEDTSVLWVDTSDETNNSDSEQNVALTPEERSTLIAVVNAFGAFDVPNGKELVNAFNVAWGGSSGEQEPDEPTIPDEPEQPDAPFQPVVADALFDIGGSCNAYTYTPNGARMIAYSSAGDVPLYNTADKFPIKVPAGATKVSVDCMGFIAGIQVLSGVERIADPGWGAINGTTLELSNYPTATSIVVSFKLPNNASIPADTDTSGITILFE